MRLHKIIQPVTDADALHFLMCANITTGHWINFPLFHVDNIAQGLQTSCVPFITGGGEFAEFPFGVCQFLFAVQPGGFNIEAVFKRLL